MEDFRGIAEESFPSFLTNSLLGNSETLENITLSSNLGLPVAVSTLARNGSSTDKRYSDVQASYLVEGRLLTPPESSPSSQTEAEPKGKLQLSFQADEKNNHTESQHLSSAVLSESAFQNNVARTEHKQTTEKPSENQSHFHRISPMEQVQASPIAVCLPAWINNKENKVVLPDTGKLYEHKILDSDLSHTSLLENEKLVSLTSLEDSSDGDIDDEEFYDDHLEAYFEQLAIPGMLYEDLDEQDSPEKDFKLPVSEPSQQVNESGSLNYKPSSENNSSLISHGSHFLRNSELTHKESEEHHPVCLLEKSKSVGTGDSTRQVDGVLPFCSSSWRIKEKETGSFKDMDSDHGRESTREVLRRTTTMRDFASMDPSKLEAGCHQNKHLASDPKMALTMDRSVDTDTCEVSIQGNVDSASLKTVSDNGVNSTDAHQSPTSIKRICECYESTEKSKDHHPQSVVYQNEEGRWVTDLAYYTSFNEEQDLNVSLTGEMNEDFRSGSEALDLIAQDEEEFNKEHRFIQEENIDAQNISGALGDTSWGTSVNYSMLRKSLSTSDLDKDDASYFRLSLGEFFAQRSEALGCLGGGHNVKRPSFGYFITSPERREPIALLTKSDVSGSNLEKETTHLNCDQFSGDVNEQSKTQVSEGSVTLQAEELGSISQVDESDVTLTPKKDQRKDTFFTNRKPQNYKDKVNDGGDSVLRISTIASAIANASVSNDPFQLAAMIKALTNKTKEKTFQEDGKQKDCSTVSPFSSSDFEKSSGSSTFDMEKYLKKTEVSRFDDRLENISRAGISDIWDLSLSKEQNVQDTQTVDLDATNLSARQPGKSSVALSYGPNGESENQESFRISSSNSVLANTRENESAVIDDSMCAIDSRLSDMDNSEKAPSVSAPLSNNGLLARSPRVASLWISEECEEIQNKKEEQRKNEYVSETSSSEKHVAFEKQPLLSTKTTDLKNSSPKHNGHGSEDEQDSFRPSTSPLSHSSPSEISGTSLSGFAFESLGLSAHYQNPPCESELCRSVCPEATMSRLTYVSEQNSTSPTPASNLGLEDRKSVITSELSTTIIQGSPAPSEVQAVETLKEKIPPQTRGKRRLPFVVQSNSDTDKVTETTSLSSRPEDGKPRLCKAFSSKSGGLSEDSAVGVTSAPSELDQSSLAALRRSGLDHPAASATTHIPVPHHISVKEGQKPTFESTSTADSTLSGQAPHQLASVSSHAPVPSYVAHGSVPEKQNVPIAVPLLLTQHSVTTAPFAPNCLGAQPSTKNGALPSCHASSSTVCGFSGSYPCPAAGGEHVQNSVAVGICLGQNMSSGSMSTAALYNPYPGTLDQNLLHTAKSFSVQSVGAVYGIDSWESGMMAEFGKVRVPEELKFPHACCVGIASQTHLSVLNPTDRWLQVSVGVLSITINGEKVDLSAYPCLVFKNKIIVRPHSTEEIKVLFIPSDPGIFRCIFSVASWPFSADSDTIVQAEALANRVVLTALAETPVIEVETEKDDVLDFGDLTYGGWKALPLKLRNKTHAVVPIRLIINANAVAWRCFTLSKEPVLSSGKGTPYANVIAQLAAPSVITHMMPASYDGQDPVLMVWVLFHSPPKQVPSSEILDSAEEFLARVDVEVDSPNPTSAIKSVGLRARIGVARIHAPKDLQTIHLFASVASSTKQHLPLKNAGNISVYLDIKLPGQGSHFSVNPEKLFLKPGEEQEVIVAFAPKDPKASEERILKIFVQPLGPQYEVVLKGEVVSSENKPLTPGSCSDSPSILSNKQFMAWGGVPLGRTQLQKLALRNNSTSATQHLRLLIRGKDQDCFQLHHTFGSEEQVTNSCEIKIHPKEDINICVLFAPTRLSCMLARLEIKQPGIQLQPGVKFTIPLSGYGGTSNLILQDVKKLSDSYLVTVKDLIPGQESRIVFSVRNTGSRAAFVKAVGFKDSQKNVLLDPKILRIFPDKFVLKERTQEDVTLIYNPPDRESNYKATTELSTIYFFGGDEISRQQFRRALSQKPGIIKQIIPEQSVLHSIDFAEVFEGELLVTEVCDLPLRPNEIQLFYGNMRKTILSVVGELRDSTCSREFLRPPSTAGLDSQSEPDSLGKHGGNVSLDVLPVKGPQGSPLLSQVIHPPQDKAASGETWTVQPEHLILVAPSPSDLAKTGRFQIFNNSVRLLKFELYWPAHCLTVTPQHGFIAPESKLQILVSPNSSLSTKQSMFPWSGFIYIHCDDGQKKMVKVQIREDLAQKELLTHLSSIPLGIQSQESDPVVHHLAKPMTKPPSTKVEIRNKTITFPATEPGETSESHLELENHGNTEVKWHLSSLAPPYVKRVNENGDVFRATYAAFRCSPISGVLESHGAQKVSITFLPRDKGDYAQFWDVECHPVKESHMKHTLRFQLSGQSVKAENETENSSISTNTLVKIDNLVKPRRRDAPEASAMIPGKQLDLTHRGVYAPEDVYQFLPTRVGESRTLKVNLRNNSFITHLLKFLSPREPFYVRHSKYSLRAQHYINMPVQFKPKSAGKFEALLVIQTDEGKSVAIRLIGEAIGKTN
ncbi:centrosomal protein of 192 kDa isoform X3 [Erinaceus europaeus]|uniref:Centrosomal protein of 192 kDa isoform X3 n=1 Tax=Erinaceus europaeus TaxID=9365 RepID=A0ABM3Y6A7_ERIEU|nr:centrosomal protein of 192 kDa isoform X3 [Erinaceus europaeus]